MKNNRIMKKIASDNVQTINALKNFKNAYYELLDAFYDGEILNETDAIRFYPFDKSFDDLPVAIWIDETVQELENKK